MSYFGFLRKYFKRMKIPLIEKGTVLDHLKPGTGFKVGNTLKLDSYVLSENKESMVSAVMGVDSTKVPGGKKDIVKIENRELDPKEVNKIALLSYATINIIQDYKVSKKYEVELPDELIGIVKCPNENCISNPHVMKDGSIRKEPVEYKAKVIDKDVPRIKCYYCEREIDDIYENLIF